MKQNAIHDDRLVICSYFFGLSSACILASSAAMLALMTLRLSANLSLTEVRSCSLLPRLPDSCVWATSNCCSVRPNWPADNRNKQSTEANHTQSQQEQIIRRVYRSTFRVNRSQQEYTLRAAAANRSTLYAQLQPTGAHSAHSCSQQEHTLRTAVANRSTLCAQL